MVNQKQLKWSSHLKEEDTYTEKHKRLSIMHSECECINTQSIDIINNNC